MSLWGAYSLVPLAALASLGLLVMSACTQSAKGGSGPMSFLEARIGVLNYDMIHVQASVLNPVEGATSAYADCVAANFSVNRLNPYLRRVSTTLSGHGDIVVEKTTYLLSPVAPGGDFVLNAQEIVKRCKTGNVPTV